MNAQRRKALAKLSTEAAELIGKLEDLKSEIETLRDEKQEYFDNMPESLQSGDKGQAAEAAIEQMDEAYNALDEFLGADIASLLDAAAE